MKQNSFATRCVAVLAAVSLLSTLPGRAAYAAAFYAARAKAPAPIPAGGLKLSESAARSAHRRVASLPVRGALPGAMAPRAVPRAGAAAPAAAGPEASNGLAALGEHAPVLIESAGSSGASTEDLADRSAWEGGRGAPVRTAAAAVQAAGPARGILPGLSHRSAAQARAASPRAAAPVGGRFERVKSAPTWAKVVAGVVLAAGLVFGGLYWHGQSKNEFWKDSKSAQEIVLVEKARSQGDADALEKVGTEAYARGNRMKQRIQEAESQGKNYVESKTKDSLKEAKAYQAFDGLVGGRAELNHNAVSQDPAKRIGQELPASWKAELARAEDSAKQSGFEGALSLRVEALKAELARQNVHAARIEGQFKAFDDHVPGLFGGNMKMHSERAAADLKEFRGSEIAPEASTLSGTESAMRGRVSDRIYGESQEFRGRRDHRDALAALQERISPVVDMAREVDKSFSELSGHLKQRQFALLMASQNEHVPVQKTDSDGNTYTVYEDHSLMWKAMAASAASSAQAEVAKINAGIKALGPMVKNLRGDPGVKAEGLQFALPDPQGRASGPGLGVWGDIFLPSFWTFLGSIGSESGANDARAKFAPALSGLQSVASEVSSRGGAEASWVNGQISADLQVQMQKAASAQPAEKR